MNGENFTYLEIMYGKSNLLRFGILDKKIIMNLKNPLKSLVQSKFSTFPRLTFGLTSIIKAPKLLSDLLTCHSTRFSLTSQPGDCFTLFEQVMSKENGPLVLTQLVVNSGLISAGFVCLFLKSENCLRKIRANSMLC